MKQVKWKLALCLLVLSLGSGTLNARAQAGEDIWRIPDIACGRDCYLNARAGADGRLYIHNRDVNASIEIMYVIEPEGEQPLVYDLKQIYRFRSTARDFLPISPEAVIFFDYQVRDVTPLTLVDLNSQQTTPLFLGVEGHFLTPCDPSWMYRDTHMLYRVGADQILLCSNYERSSFVHRAHLSADALVVDETVQVGDAIPMPSSTPPWFQMTGGADGKFYLFRPSNDEVIQRNLLAAPPALNAWEARILRYNPNATGQRWDYLVTGPYSQRVSQLQIAPDRSVADRHIIGVDESGNIYVSYLIVYGEAEEEHSASDLVKYDPEGNELWHISEQDFGGDQFFAPVMIDANTFIFYFPDREIDHWESVILNDSGEAR